MIVTYDAGPPQYLSPQYSTRFHVPLRPSHPTHSHSDSTTIKRPLPEFIVAELDRTENATLLNVNTWWSTIGMTELTQVDLTNQTSFTTVRHCIFSASSSFPSVVRTTLLLLA